MKEYTLEEWKNLSGREQMAYNAEVFKKAEYAPRRIQFYNPLIDEWEHIKSYTIDIDYQYRLKPTPEQQFQELIKRKGFEVGKKVKYEDGDEYSISDITNTKISFRDTDGIVWAYPYNSLNYIEKFELLTGPTQEEITAKFVKDNNLKIGDKLKVVRKFESDDGWGQWVEDMDIWIGKIVRIAGIHKYTIRLQDIDGRYRYFLPQSLEVVKYRPFQDGAEFEKHKGNRLIRFKKEETLSKFGIVALQTYNLDTIKVSSEKRMSFQDAFERLEFVNSITDETGEPFGVEL